MLLAKAPCGTKIVLAPSLRPRARLRALLRTDPLGHSFDGAGESAGWRDGSRPWRQWWRRRRSEGRHRGRRWLGPSARRWRDGRRGGRRKPGIRVRAANVRRGALVAIRASRGTVECSSAAVADRAAVGSATRRRTGGLDTVGTAHTQVVDAGPTWLRANGAALRCSAATVVYGATVGITTYRFTLDRQAQNRRAPADLFLADPTGHWTGGRTMERAAAAITDVATVATDLLGEHADVCSRKLAGQFGAHVRGTDADVVVANPSILRAGGRAMKRAAAPVADVAAIVKEAIRTSPWRAHLRPADTDVVLANPAGLRTGKRTRKGATAAVADVAAVLRFIRRMHTKEARTNSRRPGADVVPAHPSRSWAGFSTVERVATTVADRSAEALPVLVCAGNWNAGVAGRIGCSVGPTGIGRVGCVRRARQVNRAGIRNCRIGVRAGVRARVRILAANPAIRRRRFQCMLAAPQKASQQDRRKADRKTDTGIPLSLHGHECTLVLVTRSRLAARKADNSTNFISSASTSAWPAR